MLRRILLLSLFLPLAVFSDDDGNAVYCTGVGTPLVTCYVGSNDDSVNNSNTNVVMTSTACERIKSEVEHTCNNIIYFQDHIEQSANNIHSDASHLDDTLSVQSTEINQVATDLWRVWNESGNLSVSNDAVRLGNVKNAIDDLHGNIMSIKGEAQSIIENVTISKNAANATLTSIRNVSCDGQSCTANPDGTATCPCVQEFAAQTEVISSIRAQLMIWWEASVDAYQKLEQIKTTVSNATDYVQKVYERLNAPDDRVWSDLNEMLDNLIFGTTNKLSEIQNRTLDISQLLYNIRSAIRNTEEGNEFRLSNEGLLALYSLVGQFSTYGLASVMRDDFAHFYSDVSNTVFGLFEQFQRSSNVNNLNNMRYSLQGTRGQTLYEVATNYNQTPYSKYQRLTNVGQGNLTNWFSRMEFYQQSLLGWFDDGPESKLSDNVPQSETSIENSVDTSTNSFSQLSRVFQATNDLNSIVSPMKEVVSKLGFRASLPSSLTLIPSVSVLGNAELSFSLDLASSGKLREYCTYARNVTSLIWHVAFWALIVLICAVLVRGAAKAALWFMEFVSKM